MINNVFFLKFLKQMLASFKTDNPANSFSEVNLILCTEKIDHQRDKCAFSKLMLILINGIDKYP